MKIANIAIFIPHEGCPHQCGFCNQHRISGAQCIPNENEIYRTLENAKSHLGKQVKNGMIAFFGGSFTAIPRKVMIDLLECVQPYLSGDGFSGIRISTRPDAIDDEVLAILKRYEVKAIELGAQSMDDKVLRVSGRGHSAECVSDAAKLIKAHGFSLGLQMMTGLPFSDDKTDQSTARQLADLGPDTIRIYPTLVLEGTDFADKYTTGCYTPQTLEQAVALCASLLAYFTSRSIPVIRLGLHQSETLETDVLAGPHHPAFRELCEGRVMLKKALSLLSVQKSRVVQLGVQRGAVSKMSGQNRRNLIALEKAGYKVKIIEFDDIAYLDVKLIE